jgi:DNA polymerase III alpha subunit
MKITRLTSLGKQQTYSPEMAHENHNYITGNSPAIHKNSHAVAYCLVALKCLWLKAHFAPEWWAAVMSDCHPDKLVRYMGVARGEAWKPTEITNCGTKIDDNKKLTFDTVNSNNLTTGFTVQGNAVMQGITSIKNIGEKAAPLYCGQNDYTNIDDFINAVEGRKNKVVMERLIKLGAFKHLPNHQNSKALWLYYVYNYSSDTKAKKEMAAKLLTVQNWNETTIKDERLRQIKQYRQLYPKRIKVPPKLQNWLPKPSATLGDFVAAYDDFTADEKLDFQKEYLGFYVDSPLSVYKIHPRNTITEARRRGEGIESTIEVVLLNIVDCISKNNKQYKKLQVTDGVTSTTVMMWERECKIQNNKVLQVGNGVSIVVTYDAERHIFGVARGELIVKLQRLDGAT